MRSQTWSISSRVAWGRMEMIILSASQNKKAHSIRVGRLWKRSRPLCRRHSTGSGKTGTGR
jgi:hypothetical protein